MEKHVPGVNGFGELTMGSGFGLIKTVVNYDQWFKWL